MVRVGAIEASLGTRAAIVSMALAVGLVALVTVRPVPDRPPPASEPAASAGRLFADTFTFPLHNRPFMWLMASQLLITMGMVGMQSFALFYFSDVFFHGGAQSSVPATYAMVGVVAAVTGVVTWPAGRLSDRLGCRPMILVSGLVAALAVLLLLFGGFRLLPGQLLDPLGRALGVPPLAVQAMLVGVPAGVGFGTFLSVGWALMADIAPQERAGLFMCLANIATTGTGVLARPIRGLLLDLLNAGPRILELPGGYPVVFAVFSDWIAAGSLLARSWSSRCGELLTRDT